VSVASDNDGVDEAPGWDRCSEFSFTLVVAQQKEHPTRKKLCRSFPGDLFLNRPSWKMAEKYGES